MDMRVKEYLRKPDSDEVSKDAEILPSLPIRMGGLAKSRQSDVLMLHIVCREQLLWR